MSIEEFEPGHEDRVTVLHINDNGTRILTASIDHRVKVWDRNRDTSKTTIVDTFTAHDADIRDAKFTPTTMGSYFGTVASDLKFQLWGEDVTQAYNSGRRFRLASSVDSTPRIPFTSLDFKVIDNIYIYLALIDRQGLLSFFEPSSPDELKEWTLIDQFSVCSPTPSRGDETSFKVHFDQNDTPLPYISSLTDDSSQLSLAVTSINDVRIYHSTTTEDTSTSPLSSATASHRIKFHQSFVLPTHPSLVRSIAWSSFNVRGVERIATACKDGSIRIFELAIMPSQHSDSHNDSSKSSTNNARQARSRQPQQSSLTSAITGRPAPNTAASSSSNTRQTKYAFPFMYQIQHVSTLPAHGDAWSVSWDAQGQVLMSGGSDGVTKLWRKSVQEGKWMLFADQAVEFGETEEGES